nr:hypothetical protein [Tanacetum cinerariifolium]
RRRLRWAPRLNHRHRLRPGHGWGRTPWSRRRPGESS